MEPVSVFLSRIQRKNPAADLSLIEKAYKYAMVAHSGQRRASGEDFFEHPYRVCLLLLRSGIADTATICAALLHDIVEDTSISIAQVVKEFNEEVATIVEGLTKLDKRQFSDISTYKAENLRKIILATAKDPRVMIIKLCDRLDNMQTLGIFREEKRKRIAHETLEVYAPIAQKLGLWRIKGDLEDLAFEHMHPEDFAKIKDRIKLTREKREHNTQEMIRRIRELLSRENVDARVSGRAKYFYSIYQKMRKENKTFEQIYDLYGIRIIVPNKQSCYHALEVLKEEWEFIEDRFKDYIESPKANLYQSLHANFKVGSRVIEVQIRTKDMDEVAESGVASHWKYKQTERDKKFDQKINWVKQFLQWVTTKEDKELTMDVFKNQIIAMTPKGDPIMLIDGATPLDFAYAVHSSVGDHAVRAEVNGTSVPLSAKLDSGDIVNIVTTNKKTVSSSWLTFVRSPHTAAKIRRALHMESDTRSAKQYRKRHQDHKKDREAIETLAQLQDISGKTKIKLSKCCNPVRSSKIVAFYTRDKKTITVHKHDCPDQFALDPNLKISLVWSGTEEYRSVLEAVCEDKAGIIIHILEALHDHGLPIQHISSKESKGNVVVSIETERSLEELTPVVTALKAVGGIINVTAKSH